MARKLEVTNPSGITKVFESYYINGIEEAVTDYKGFLSEFGVSIVYERSPFQQGATAVALRAETRPLSFVLHIVRSSQEALRQRAAEVVQFFNPYDGEMTIVHDNNVRRRRIKAYYTTHALIEYEDQRGYGTLAINLMADSALFEDEFEQVIDMGSSAGAFTLPLELPFGVGQDLAEITYINTGDYYNPVEMLFYGPLEDPELIRDYVVNNSVVQTDKVKFENLVVPEYWYIRVNTEQGREEATLVDPDGNEENINRYLSVDSNYWQLFKGENKIRFATLIGNPVTQLRFRRKYIVA